MASIPAYNEYADKVLMLGMDQTVLEEIKRMEATGDYENPHYMELLIPHHYVQHVLRMPFDNWPEPVNRAFKTLNSKIYVPLHGPSELGASGKLIDWDRTADLHQITVPTLAVGARYDTMDPAHMEWIAKQVQKGQYLYCSNGSHMTMYDDQKTYMDGVIQFLQSTDANF